VRERKVLSLEDAIARMTGRSAQRLGLTDRGVVAVGKKADLVVFDAGAIADRGTPAAPAQSPVGIDLVIVNGQVVLDHGTMTGAHPGRPLKRQ
jgi:N-acyl-D-amino-acid deacylase